MHGEFKVGWFIFIAAADKQWKQLSEAGGIDSPLMEEQSSVLKLHEEFSSYYRNFYAWSIKPGVSCNSGFQIWP